MKIAILLLVHKNKEQVQRLLSALQHDHVDIFIHLDKKCPLSPSDFTAPNLIFTEKRFDIGLFEFSMVQAEIELIRTARQHDHYDYFIVMSGQCYPLAHIDKIYAFLCEKYPEPFMDIDLLTEKNRYFKIFKHVYILKRFKLKSYAFLKKHFPFRVFRILRCIPGGAVEIISRIKELFVKSPQARLKRKGIRPYFGSQWWILPDKIMDQIYPVFDDREFCDIMSDCFSCDETFFQTAIMAYSDHANISMDENGFCRKRPWFILFQEGHPIILTSAHYEQMLASGMLFARKFDMDTSPEILDMLDEKNSHESG